MKYVAFLLGINLGTRTIKMVDLKKLVEELGYTDVYTVLASGNVLFDARREKPQGIAKKLEMALEKRFGFTVGVIVHTKEDIEAIWKSNPFKKVTVTKNTRRYVTFLSEEPPATEKARVISPQYKILKVTPGEIYSVLELSPELKTPDIMKLLSTSFGKKITTRNWNTIEKILKVS